MFLNYRGKHKILNWVEVGTPKVNLLFTSFYMKFAVTPKYLNFATFLKDLLAAFI
jgi:hypothetical protein